MDWPLPDQDLVQFGVLVEGRCTGDLGVALHACPAMDERPTWDGVMVAIGHVRHQLLTDARHLVVLLVLDFRTKPEARRASSRALGTSMVTIRTPMPVAFRLTIGQCEAAMWAIGADAS